MLGQYARISTVVPRPVGTYRFTIRMKAEAPMTVTIDALGACGVFDVGTDWERYEILIDSPTTDYVDIYPLANTALDIEKAQLTFGSGSYDWRPAPEDEVTYAWTATGMDEVTISHILDIVAYAEYYQLLPTISSAPAAPTTYPPPAPWTPAEPTLDPTDGTSNTLYRCAVTVFSDGTYSWSEVSVSTSYEAAKAALNISTTYKTEVEQLLDSWTVTVQETVVDNTTDTTISDMWGMVQVNSEKVALLVEQTHMINEDLSERITSLQEQTSTDITNTFTRAVSYADDTYGGVKQYVETAQTWQRFSATGIEQGAMGSPFKSVLNNEELGFYENDRRVAYLNNSQLAIENGRINDTLTVGLFSFSSGADGFGISYNGNGGD